jgi:hypothetical protein
MRIIAISLMSASVFGFDARRQINSNSDFARIEMITGYLHPGYAASLAEFGTPRLLPRSEGWILERQIPGSPYSDGMGCYPLFACQDWSQLHADLESIGSELVSLALVTDPFGKYDVTSH